MHNDLLLPAVIYTVRIWGYTGRIWGYTVHTYLGIYSTYLGIYSTYVSGNIQDVSGDIQYVSGDIQYVSGDIQYISGDIQYISGDIQYISGDMYMYVCAVVSQKHMYSQTWVVRPDKEVHAYYQCCFQHCTWGKERARIQKYVLSQVRTY